MLLKVSLVFAKTHELLLMEETCTSLQKAKMFIKDHLFTAAALKGSSMLVD